jgi:acyl-CoA synthetase (NDP forming)
VDDPAVSVIGVFLEGLKDVPAFHDAALHAAAKGVPIVVLKSGQSEAGARLAFSHTSSIAGTDAMYDALFARTGVIRVRSVPELQEQLKLLSVWGATPGRRIVVFSTSGGDSGMAADFADAAGLDLPQPDDAQRAGLRKVLPDYGAVSNPLDFTATFWGQEGPLEGVFTTLAARNVDKAVFILDGPREGPVAGTAHEGMTRALKAAATAAGIQAATASVMPDSPNAAFRQAMLDTGVAPLQGVHDAMRVIAAAARRAEWGAGFAAGDVPLALAPPVAADETRATMLDEATAKAALARHGLAVPSGTVAGQGDIGAAAAALGFPVAVKALHPALAHKTEAGGVVLGVADAAAAEAAARRIRSSVAAYDRSIDITRFLVERMVAKPVAELIVGVQRDPAFGLALVIGAGGVLVELMRSATTLLLPVRRGEVEAVLRSGVIGRLLGGFRGGTSGDLAAATDAVMAIADFAAANADRLVELDVNPLIVMPEGAVAVDALIRLNGSPVG